MCAMMPMLRTLLRSVVMSTATGVSLWDRCWKLVVTAGAALSPVRRAGVSRDGPGRASPAVVGEGLVGLGHLVNVLATLDRGTEAVGRVEDLVHEALGHRLLAT